MLLALMLRFVYFLAVVLPDLAGLFFWNFIMEVLRDGISYSHHTSCRTVPQGEKS